MLLGDYGGSLVDLLLYNFNVFCMLWQWCDELSISEYHYEQPIRPIRIFVMTIRPLPKWHMKFIQNNNISIQAEVLKSQNEAQSP